MQSPRLGTIVGAVLALVVISPLVAQNHGSGGGGGGCGDVFGDLIHILRDDQTGQPILAQRWVELPAEVQGYGWGYCPIAVYTDTDGAQVEIPFVPYTCDLDPAYLEQVVEVNYFGRLNGGRTKERNHRMHLNETISNIKAADLVKQDPTGRLMMGFDCEDVAKTPCDVWATVDSPMESMALYTRLMKYGHLATNPYEIDTWAHGDPKLGAQFNPALAEEDFAKFHNSVQHLLPYDGDDPESCWDYLAAEEFTDEEPFNDVWDPAEPFIDINKNGVRDADWPGLGGEPFTDLNDNKIWDDSEEFTDINDNGVADAFTFLCADPEYVDNKDFLRGAAFLSAAANKTGKVTVDLVQYMNRILKITKKTATTEATLATLPAKYRDCWDGADPEDPIEGTYPGDPDYLEICDEVEADIPADPSNCASGTPNHCLYPDVQELFVDFSGLDDYGRESEQVAVIYSTSENSWFLNPQLELGNWVAEVHPDDPATNNIDGFVDAANDRLRSIEFIHNYDPPVDLYCLYGLDNCGE